MVAASVANGAEGASRSGTGISGHEGVIAGGPTSVYACYSVIPKSTLLMLSHDKAREPTRHGVWPPSKTLGAKDRDIAVETHRLAGADDRGLGMMARYRSERLGRMFRKPRQRRLKAELNFD